ncbi:MAG: CSLREA domain-containing protein [Thermoleophilia bacterium]|nr:CSLREA domain-containing protein [Thermoleophilia bacterium]
MATAVAMLVAAPSAGAVDIPVNTTDDVYGGSPANCSLREAITAAQTNAAFDGCPAGLATDVIKVPGGTYKITRAGANEDANVTGDFDVVGTNVLTIERAQTSDKVVVDGNGLDRVFDQQGANTLSLRFIQVKGGVLTLIEDGGGIRNGSGSLSLEGVTVSGNESAFSAGGIAVYSSLAMVNSTISGNKSAGQGGGLYMPGGSLTTVRSSTITNNTADSDAEGNGDGGGFADTNSNGVNFFNVINAGNKDLSPLATSKSPDCYASSTLFFPRYVLTNQPLPSATCLVGFNPGSNQVVADAMIGPLQDNGGSTPTHEPLLGSPAIGAGGSTAPDTCPATDQTGRDRPAGACDIGAVQYFEEPPPPPPGTVAVKFTKFKPKPLKLKRGKKAKAVSVTITSTGTAGALNTKVCVQPGKAAKKSLKLVGKFCRKPGTLVGNKTVKFKFKAKKKAKKKKFKIKTVLTATDAAPKTGTIVIKVK